MKKSNKSSTGKKRSFACIVFPLLTLICLAGFIGSLIFPNKVLDTYEINMTQEEGEPEVLLPLSYDMPIEYEVDTKGRQMYGIQLGINKRGFLQQGKKLSVKVFSKDTGVSEMLYDIEQGDELQYVYLPFEDPEKCVGQLRIELVLAQGSAASKEDLPALTANFNEVPDTKTVISEDQPVIASEPDDAGEIDDSDTDSNKDNDKESLQVKVDELKEKENVSLKGYHIYSHDTYPFLYDFRLLTFVFLAVSMTLSYRGRRKA